MFRVACVWILIFGCVYGRMMVVNEYDMVGEDGMQGHSWTITQDTELPSMIMQVSEYHSDGMDSQQMSRFYSPNDFFKKALMEFAWISQQFDMLAELEEKLMSSCSQSYYMMNDMYGTNSAVQETTIATPPPSQDTDSLYKYMSFNRFQPMSIGFIQPYQPYDNYVDDYNSYAIFEIEDEDNNRVIMTSDGTLENRFYDTFYDTYSDYDTLDYDYEIQEEDQAECFMLTLFLALACSVIFLGVLASFSKLSKTIKLAQNKKIIGGGSDDEEKSSLKASLLSPLKPEPAKGLVVAADHVKNADGGRFVDVVYVPLRGD